MSQSPQSLAPVRPRHPFSERVIALGARLWHAIGWIWSTVIVGGFLVGLLLSYLITGTSGLPNPDPRTWFFIRPLLAHPLVTSIVLIVALLLSLGSNLAARHEKREQQEQERAREESLKDIGRGVRELLEERKTPPTSTPSPAPVASAVSIYPDTSPPSTPVCTVPYRRNPFFTGRENLLTLLHDRLTTTGAAALTQALAISGLGGIGKTQTAVEFAYRYQQDYQYVLWVRAAARDTLIADFVTIAALLHLPEKDERDQTRVVAAVKDWLAQHAGWLLILDNADDVELARTFLPAQGKGHILLTTRAQATGAVAEPIAVEKMDQDEGMLLLLRRARVPAADALPDKASEADRTTARTIVKAMDGLPLALDQAGAYIEQTGCGLSRYLELYQQRRTDLLRWRSALSPEYPHTVATTWSLSFRQVEQVNPAAADLLRLCAFLDPDAIPEEIITKGASQLGPVLESVASDAWKLNEAIDVLRTYSLIRRTPDAQSLVIHRLVQVVLKDSMDPQVQRQWAERTVRAVNAAFPDERWLPVQHLLPHALACAALIDQHQLNVSEAARLLDRTATYLQDHGQYPQAEPLFQQALAIYEKALGPEHPYTSATLNNLARLYQDQGRYGEAEPLFQQALAICEKALGPEHPYTSTTLNNLAGLYQDQGRYREAEPLFQRALASYEKVLGPEHPYTSTTLNNLALLYRYQERHGEAEPLYLRSLAIREKALGPEHPYISTTLNNLALLYQAQGRHGEAEPLYLRALAIREKALGPEHPWVATALENYASLLQSMKRLSEAAGLKARAQAIRARHRSQNHIIETKCVPLLEMLPEAHLEAVY